MTARLAELEKQQRANEQAYADGSITADEYRKKTEENTIAMQEAQAQWDEYKKWLDVINDKHLNYIEKIKQLNALKLNPSAYDALIQKIKNAQSEQIKLLNLQRLTLNQKVLDADKEINQTKSTFPIIEWQWWLSTNSGPSQAQLNILDLQINKRNKLSESIKNEDDALKKQIDSILLENKAWESLIKTFWWTGGWWGSWWVAGAKLWAKKENEALKKSVDHLKDSYKILDNEITKVENARKKEVDAEKKWHATLQQSQQDTVDSLVKVRDEYDKTVAKLNEDSTKQSIDSTGDYYRSLLEAKKEAERDQASSVGTDKLFDPARLEVLKKQIEEIQTAKNTDGSFSLDQNSRAKEDQRAWLTDQEKARFDFMEKYGQIQLDLANNVSAATDKFAESRGQIEGMQNIVNAFENTKLRGSGLDSLAKSLKLQNTDKEAQALVDKLLTEKRNLITITDERISAESRVHAEAMRLSTAYHVAELDMVRARKTEYDDLIAKIRVAIDMANALRAAQASVWVSSSPSSSKKWFSDGGYTGDGAVSDVAGVVHKGEYVIPQSVIAHMQSNMPHIIPNLEALRQGNRSSTSHIDQSRHVSITGPINVERPIDFENLLARAAWRNR